MVPDDVNNLDDLLEDRDIKSDNNFDDEEDGFDGLDDFSDISSGGDDMLDLDQ